MATRPEVDTAGGDGVCPPHAQLGGPPL